MMLCYSYHKAKELKKDDDGNYNDEKETGNRSNKVVKTQKT